MTSIRPPDTQFPVGQLRLELRRGCHDDAVSGGTSGFMGRWARSVAPLCVTELRDRLEKIAAAFDGYPTLGQAAREELCDKTLRAFELYRKRFPPPQLPDGHLTARSSVRHLKGVGPKRLDRLVNMGISTIGDLLRHYPVRYDDRRNALAVASLEHRQSATVRVTVDGPGKIKRFRGRSMAEVPATDGTTPLTITWFNQPYRANQFEVGQELLVSGQVMIRNGKHSITASEFEALDPGEESERINLGRITPVYPLSTGVNQSFLRGLVRSALDEIDELPSGTAPEDLIEKRHLMGCPEAIRQIHFPDDDTTRRNARARIAYEELFLLQAALARRRLGLVTSSPDAGLPTGDLVSAFSPELPFQLTGAQVRVIAEIDRDLKVAEPANRLIHGDVGSGKTVCAAYALLAAARAGRQAAIMAPTELLAEQHHRVVGELLAPFGIRCRLLVGALGAAAKGHAHRRIATGVDQVIVGTQAVFQDAVEFDDLAVVVIDEQHRFGVRQRAQLAEKGLCPNVFVMSATPIPRTLAITAYGDFDVSVLDELPPGRKPVHTQVAWGNERKTALDTLAARVAMGQQAYVVCPVIDGGAEGNVAAAEEEFDRLRNGEFAGFSLGLLHGRMATDERDLVMDRFRAGEIEVLVATTVIEVGVDVPNAAVMLIQNAERFGLAQLHQLRGRVGRGVDESICILLTRAKAPDVIDRLRVLERTSDGFEIAEEDLRRRGPGELTGTRQSGLPELRMADLLADTQTLVKAREDAFAIIESDPDLELPEHEALRQALYEFEFAAGDWAM